MTIRESRVDQSEGNVVHDRVAWWASEQPQSLAVVDGDVRITYSELNAWSDAVASRLLAQGVSVEDAVAVNVGRGHRAIVAFLGTLKAGACYVPVDPSYPAERQELMLTDSRSVVRLTADDVDAARASAAAGDPATMPEAHPDNLAYIVYTSGSTGRPKGVMVEHRNVCALLSEPLLAVQPGETVAQTVSLAFDVATFEIWAALARGGTLVVMPSGDDIARLTQTIRTVAPDWMFLTAGVFHLVVDSDPESLSHVGVLLAGGDVLGPAQWDRAAREPQVSLVNAYGPSETTTFSGLHEADPSVTVESVPIGRAPHREYMEFEDPDAGSGEILIGGLGVSRGYRDRPRLTAERFIPDPSSPSPGGRRYRSGDLGELSDDNVMLIHGRVDRQVKIRGFRIELAEVESTLVSHPEVSQAAVITVGDGTGKRMGAYVSLTDEAEIDGPALLTHLGRKLPHYMVPSGIRVLDTIPLDPNGKVDRKNLPDLWNARSDIVGLADYRGPSSDLQELICDVWGSVLELDEVGLDDNFYVLGGDSLRGVSILERLSEAGYEVSATEFLDNQSPAALGGLIEEKSTTSTDEP